MTILDTIKSLLGLKRRDERDARETTVTVEREGGGADGTDEPVAGPTDAAASTESLVDEESAREPAEAAEVSEAAGPGAEDVEIEEAEPESGVDEPVAEPTDAAASTESLVDEENADDPAEAAEVAEAAGPESDDIDTDVEDVEVDADGETATEGESVETIKGIGPAYAERLGEVGVHSVADLAAADADDLAERIAVSEKRIARWIDRAQERRDE